MRIFVDSADLDHITQAKAYGVLDGVTTNPSLIKKAVDKLQKKGEQIDIRDYIKKILEVAKGYPVSLEVIGTNYDDMVTEGKMLFETFNPVADNVYIKVPVDPSFSRDSDMHFDGLKAIKTLADQGIPVNCTLIFTPEQALLAAKAGAHIVSPFAGRIDDYLRSENNIPFDKTDYFPAAGLLEGEVLEDNGVVSGIDLVQQCVEVLDNYNFETQVLAASLRNTRQTREAALAGAHIATLPFDVISELLTHDKTIEGMESFTKDIVPEYAQLFK